jgi:hypothetical protein
LKKEHIIILGVAIIGLLIYTGYIKIPAGVIPGQQVTTTINQPASTVAFVPASGFSAGDFDVDITAYDSFVPSTTYTVTSVSATTWYIKEGGAYVAVGSGDNTITVGPESGGILYGATTGAANYYIDAWTMDAKSSYIKNMQYFDIDGQSPDEFVFTISLDGIVRHDTTPKIPYSIYILYYEAPSVSTVSDTVTTVGTTAIEKFFEFYTEQTTLNRAYAMYKVDMYFEKGLGSYTPQDDVSRLQTVKFLIPGKGYVDVTSSMQIRSNDLYYSYTLGTDMGDAWFIKTGQNDLNKQYFTVSIKFLMESSDPGYRICWTMYYLAPLASGAHSTGTASDSVYVSD